MRVRCTRVTVWKRSATSAGVRSERCGRTFKGEIQGIYGKGKGTLNGQPINGMQATLRNLPEEAVYNWEPGAQFGIYNPDTFWFDDEAG